jgi:hypothetical protein
LAQARDGLACGRKTATQPPRQPSIPQKTRDFAPVSNFAGISINP